MLRACFTVFFFSLTTIVTLRCCLLYTPLVEHLLSEELLLHDAARASYKLTDSGAPSKEFLRTTLPWHSVSELEQQHGRGATLDGGAVRELYTKKLIHGQLDDWVENQLASMDTALEAAKKKKKHQQEEKSKHANDAKKSASTAASEEADAVLDDEASGKRRAALEAYTASSCSRMRHHAKLYTRRRHSLHPVSTEFLGWRDAWVHGVRRGSWRNVVACLAQHEDYTCPGLVDRFHASLMEHRKEQEAELQRLRAEGVWTAADDAKADNGEEQLLRVESAGAGAAGGVGGSGDYASKRKQLFSWVKSTLKSCRRSNKWWDAQGGVAGEKKDKAKSMGASASSNDQP